MVFRRRRESEDQFDEDEEFDVDDVLPGDEEDDEDDEQYDEHSPAALEDLRPSSMSEPYAVSARTRPKGPWDSHDVPRDSEVARVDLGGIAVPIPDGLEVRVEVQDDVPVAATLVDGGSQLQVHAFAAPKSSGLWAEVRSEIASSLRGSGGEAVETEGPFGTELRTRLPQDGGGTQPARFLGVDGPRWFLRGLLTGPGSTDPNQARRLEAAFREVVVNRGSDAMAPRDMLPLHLPREATETPPVVPDRSLQLPERGPEITEIQ
jgi:hypothetical protein